jgi:hypothetical protein
MSLFGKKQEMKKNISNVPELPELPRLPELPSINELSYEEEQLPQLPRFPNNSLGDKFSQNTIKEAISGKKEEDEVFHAEDFSEDEKRMMQKPLQRFSREDSEGYETGISTKIKTMEDSEDYEEKIPTKTKSREVPQEIVTKNYMTRKAEPVFIRIDKFEESMKIFKDIRSQVSEIENLIKNTKEIKAKEEEELVSWETEIQAIKNQIERVNQDIFSKIE